MTDAKTFKKTEIVVSYGYILWYRHRNGTVRIGFMRKPYAQPHHGLDDGWMTATVTGRRRTEQVMDEHSGPHFDGFMGQPPSAETIADQALKDKLGVVMDAQLYVPPLEGWIHVTYPFAHSDLVHGIRHVQTLNRKVRRLETTEMDILRTGLAARNIQVRTEFVHHIQFFTVEEFEQTIVKGNLSLPRVETDLMRSLYKLLTDKDQYHFQAEAHLALAT